MSVGEKQCQMLWKNAIGYVLTVRRELIRIFVKEDRQRRNVQGILVVGLVVACAACKTGATPFISSFPNRFCYKIQSCLPFTLSRISTNLLLSLGLVPIVEAMRVWGLDHIWISAWSGGCLVPAQKYAALVLALLHKCSEIFGQQYQNIFVLILAVWLVVYHESSRASVGAVVVVLWWLPRPAVHCSLQVQAQLPASRPSLEQVCTSVGELCRVQCSLQI